MKRIFLLLALVVTSTTAFSQITVRPGIRSGVNFAKLTNTGSDSKTDFYIGGFAAIEFARFYTLQAELTYTRQGADSKFSSDFDIELQYLSFAVANKFFMIPGMGLHAIVGPAINIKVSDNYGDGFDSLEDFDFVLFGGLGYEFPFGLTLEARYNIGLVDIFGYNINNDVSFDDVILNEVIQLGVAYKFDF